MATVIGYRWCISLSVPQTWRALWQMGWAVRAAGHHASERDEQAVATRESVRPVVERR
ncbi:winged helix-turn-helix domain-containing protein [Streptomyces triticisoli]|uniref:winged helix-turn-helix domain-containing protein n=1 Tax=Streptomyces triticisoli TaxID=2182797 RepID=UPI0013004630|nr:winged helix-turn-helix domain-containing protein [Streptomyces triticisoli]